MHIKAAKAPGEAGASGPVLIEPVVQTPVPIKTGWSRMHPVSEVWRPAARILSMNKGLGLPEDPVDPEDLTRLEMIDTRARRPPKMKERPYQGRQVNYTLVLKKQKVQNLHQAQIVHIICMKKVS